MFSIPWRATKMYKSHLKPRKSSQYEVLVTESVKNCSQGDAGDACCCLLVWTNTSLISWTNIRHIEPHWRLLSHCGESGLLPLDSIIFSTLCYPRNIPVLSTNSALGDYQGCRTTIRELQRVSCVGGTWKEATTAEKKPQQRRGG